MRILTASLCRKLSSLVIGGALLAAMPAMAQEKAAAEKWLDGELPYAGPEITYDGPPITVRFAHFLGANTPLTIILDRAAARLREESKGKLIVRPFYSNSLHDAQRGGFEGVAGGISDMATCYSWINPGGFDLQLGLQFPFLFQRGTVGAHAIMQIYPKYFKEKYEAHGVLFARSTVTPPQHLITRDQPIKSIDDVRGRRMMASGAIATDITTAFGAVPVPLTVAEYYTGFQQGVVDIMVIHDAGLKLFRFTELAKHRTETNLWSNPIEYCMNPDFFAKLPDDLRELFQLWLMRHNHAEAELYFDKVAAEGRAEAKERGIETIQLPEAEFKRFVDASQPVVDKWVADMEAKGLPAKQMLEDLRAKIAELDKMSDDELFMLTYDKVYPGLVD